MWPSLKGKFGLHQTSFSFGTSVLQCGQRGRSRKPRHGLSTYTPRKQSCSVAGGCKMVSVSDAANQPLFFIGCTSGNAGGTCHVRWMMKFGSMRGQQSLEPLTSCICAKYDDADWWASVWQQLHIIEEQSSHVKGMWITTQEPKERYDHDMTWRTRSLSLEANKMLQWMSTALRRIRTSRDNVFLKL